MSIEQFVNKIHCGNCVDVMKLIPNNSVDLVVTSPPYKENDGFSWELISELAIQIFRIIKNNSLVYINFGHLANYKSRPLKLALIFENCGFNFIDTIIWYKHGMFTPLQGSKRFDNKTEYIFQFSKGKNYSLDRASIGLPYMDKNCIKRYNRFGKGDLTCRGNLWDIMYKVVQSKKDILHKDRFPLDLPLLCISSSSKENDLVMDPFFGSGTTGLATKKLKRRFIGIELNREYCNIADKRIGGVEIVEYPVDRHEFTKYVEKKEDIKIYKPLKEGNKCNYSGYCPRKSFDGKECLIPDKKCLKEKK